MRKIILVLGLMILFHTIKSQIVLEHVFDSASTVTNSGQLLMINFEEIGWKYIRINYESNLLSVYNMDFSIYKNIDLTPLTQINILKTWDFLYFSQKLFNNDHKIEFLCTYKYNPPRTRIYNEDGVVIFEELNACPLIKVNIPQHQQPIYNTPHGTKMILSYNDGTAKVFRLPGSLSQSIYEANLQLLNMQMAEINHLYPNPSSNEVTIEYQLPDDVPSGEIILFDQLGMEVRRFKITNSSQKICIQVNDLPSGLYFYQLFTPKGASGSKKSFVVK